MTIEAGLRNRVDCAAQGLLRLQPGEHRQQLLHNQGALVVTPLSKLPRMQRHWHQDRSIDIRRELRSVSDYTPNVSQCPKPLLIFEGIEQLPNDPAKQSDRPTASEFGAEMLAMPAMRFRVGLSIEREAAGRAPRALDQTNALGAANADRGIRRSIHRPATTRAGRRKGARKDGFTSAAQHLPKPGNFWMIGFQGAEMVRGKKRKADPATGSARKPSS